MFYFLLPPEHVVKSIKKVCKENSTSSPSASPQKPFFLYAYSSRNASNRKGNYPPATEVFLGELALLVEVSHLTVTTFKPVR
jgi:hypothetical protein